MRAAAVVRASAVVYNFDLRAVVAQLVERVLGKDEVTGSIPVNGSRFQLRSAGFHRSNQVQSQKSSFLLRSP